MNDKDRELIEMVLQRAGSAGEQGFAHLVRYYATDGVVGIFGYGCLLTLCVYLFRRMLAWDADNDGVAVRGICMGVIVIAAVCFIVGFFSSISQIIAPEGAAIRSVLSVTSAK